MLNGRDAGRQTVAQVSRQAERQTGWQAGRQADRPDKLRGRELA